MSTTTLILAIIFTLAVGALIGLVIAWVIDIRRDRDLSDQDRQRELREWDEE